MNDNNFNILFEKIGHIEATQAGIYHLLERIEANASHFETRLHKVEKQAVRLLTICGICAFLITAGLSYLSKII